MNVLNIESRYKFWYNNYMRNRRISKAFLYYLAYFYKVPRELAKRISNYNENNDDD